MKKMIVLGPFFLCLSLSLSAPSSFGKAPAAAARGKKPRLVVLLTVDQFRADYIDWYGASWKHGLRRLLDHGAHFRNARYPYLGTVTCAGHTTLGTGAYPHTHGMVLNDWWDRQSQSSRSCTDDPAVHLVGLATDVQETGRMGDSATNILIPSLGDEMKAQLKTTSRVVVFSLKARSAIGLAGHKADVVGWFDQGRLVTSSAFPTTFDASLKKYLAANPVDRDLDQKWTKLLDEKDYRYTDDALEEPPTARVFPYSLKPSKHIAATTAKPPAATRWAQPIPSSSAYARWERSPWSDAYLAHLASAAVSGMGLGKGPGVDFLAVSFSALDIMGHGWGPRSHEIQDILARLDVAFGDFLADLDQKVGADNYVLAFSSDHGVMELPEQLKAEGKDAGRVSANQLATKVQEALRTTLGLHDQVMAIRFTDVYLAPESHEQLKTNLKARQAAVAAAASVVGVERAFYTEELLDPALAKDPVQRAAALSHLPARSGDIVIIPRRYWVAGPAPTGTTHGTLQDYDQHVPVIFTGAGIKAGHHDRAISPADIAPTLGRFIGVKLPRAEGHALAEIAPR